MAGTTNINIEGVKTAWGAPVTDAGVAIVVPENTTQLITNNSPDAKIHLSFVSAADVAVFTVPLVAVEQSKSPYIPPGFTIELKIPRGKTALYAKTSTGLTAELSGHAIRLGDGTKVA